jgi:hypothetical protein
MQRTLRQHIAELEQTIVNLKAELRKADLVPYQRAERELALLNAQEALSLFRRAYEVEKRVPKLSD